MAASLPPLVLTGATGFVGRRVVELLRDPYAPASRAKRDVTLLVRDPTVLSRAALPANWHVVAADLASEALAPDAIAPGSVVVHLAAATGTSAPEVMRAVIVEGTRRLVAASVAAGAVHFVYVSSIAASFEDRRWYPYAEAKRDAEAIVAGSGLRYTIVRPTMVFGPGSPVLEGLERLALGGAPIVLGSGSVEVQPIHVDDLAYLLLALAGDPPHESETFEAGGAHRFTMRALLARIRQVHSLPPRRVWGVPLDTMRGLLALAERIVGPRLPVTAGQLASFVNHSTARPSARVEALLPVRRTLGDMLEESASPSEKGDASPAGMGEESRTENRGTSATEHGDASQRVPQSIAVSDGDDVLAREFATFAAYLGSPAAGARAAASYARAHPSVAAPRDAFDRWLVAVARRSSFACALADAYARVTRPYGTLRCKLVLALAVLESSPGLHRAYDTARPSATVLAWGGIIGAGCFWIARSALAALLLAPLQLAARFAGDRGAGPAEHD